MCCTSSSACWRRGGRARLPALPGQEATGRRADQCRPRRAEDTEQVMRAVPVASQRSRCSPSPAPAHWRQQQTADARERTSSICGSASACWSMTAPAPAGQIKEVSGAQMTPAGIVRTRKMHSAARGRSGDRPTSSRTGRSIAAPERAALPGKGLLADAGIFRRGRDHHHELEFGIDEDRLAVDAEQGEPPLLARKQPELIAIAEKRRGALFGAKPRAGGASRSLRADNPSARSACRRPRRHWPAACRAGRSRARSH